MFSKTVSFPRQIKKVTKLDSNICTSTSYSLLKKRILEFIKVHPNNICNFPNSLDLTCLTKLPVALSRLHCHKDLIILCLIHEAWYGTVTKPPKSQSTTLSIAQILCTKGSLCFKTLKKLTLISYQWTRTL